MPGICNRYLWLSIDMVIRALSELWLSIDMVIRALSEQVSALAASVAAAVPPSVRARLCRRTVRKGSAFPSTA